MSLFSDGIEEVHIHDSILPDVVDEKRKNLVKKLSSSKDIKFVRDRDAHDKDDEWWRKFWNLAFNLSYIFYSFYLRSPLSTLLFSIIYEHPTTLNLYSETVQIKMALHENCTLKMYHALISDLNHTIGKDIELLSPSPTSTNIAT